MTDEIMKTIPWLTQEGFEFLKEYFGANKGAKVLEFGAGGSTIWMAESGIDLVSVDHSKTWHGKVKDYLVSKGIHVDLRLMERPYNLICDEFPDNHFDFILVDGRDRVKCALSAEKKLKPGGVLLLDDSQRHYYVKVFDMCASWKKTEVRQIKPDMDGNVNPERTTTWWVKPLEGK